MSAERITATVLGLIMVLPVATVAQEEAEPGLQTGDRIRVTAPGMGLVKLEGTLAAVDNGSRILRIEAKDRTIAVPIDSLRALQVARGEGSKATGLVAGFAVGALVGGGVGAAAGEDCSDTGLAPCFDRGSVALIGAVLGGAIGAGIGSRVSRGTRWQPVPLQDLALIISPLGVDGPAVLASIRF